MNFSMIKEIEEFFKKIENKINENSKELMNEIYKKLQQLEEKNKDCLNLSSYNESQFSIKFYDYEILFVLMNGFAIPKDSIVELEKVKYISLRKIFSDENYKRYYCGCISIYYNIRGNECGNEDNMIFLNRIFINKDFDIAIQDISKYIQFESKEIVLKRLDNIIINIFSKLYEIETTFPGVSEVFKLNKEYLWSEKNCRYSWNWDKLHLL